MGEGDDLRALGDDLGCLADHDAAVVVHVEPAQNRTGASSEFLPWDEVGVVLGRGDDNLVTGRDRKALGCGAAATERGVLHRVGDDVDRRGRT